MQTINRLIVAIVLLAQTALAAGQQKPAEKRIPAGDSWKLELKDSFERGRLRDGFEKVRGDSGKWNDDPRLQHAPPIGRKPSGMSLDDWADLLQRKRHRKATVNDDNWLLFKTRQLDDNDRVWIERIERRGNQFEIVLNQAIWQGRYFKSFTYYNVFGVNLGKLSAGEYTAKWIIRPLVFREFEGNGRPRDEKRRDNWSKDERPADARPKVLSVSFTVTATDQ